jgi:hypothetical protein
MAYSLFSQTYDITLKNSYVTISNKWTGVPAIIMQSPLGGLVNNQGLAKLDNEAQLNVYIDTSQEWTVKVLDGQVLQYNVLEPKKILSIPDLLNIVPEFGVTYVLDKAPYTEYTWDGVNLVASLTSDETAMIQMMANSSVGQFMYNIDGKITSYVRNGILHNVDYPDPNTWVFSNTTGVVKTVTVDGSERVTSII